MPSLSSLGFHSRLEKPFQMLEQVSGQRLIVQRSWFIMSSGFCGERSGSWTARISAAVGSPGIPAATTSTMARMSGYLKAQCKMHLGYWHHARCIRS